MLRVFAVWGGTTFRLYFGYQIRVLESLIRETTSTTAISVVYATNDGCRLPPRTPFMGTKFYSYDSPAHFVGEVDSIFEEHFCTP